MFPSLIILVMRVGLHASTEVIDTERRSPSSSDEAGRPKRSDDSLVLRQPKAFNN